MAEVIKIYTSAANGEETVEQPVVVAHAGRGLVGDRYYRENIDSDNRNAITLQSIEAIEACNRQLNSDFPPSAFRRNLITRGIKLNELLGRRFYVGDVLLYAWELCQPCDYLQKILQAQVLTGLLDRGGLRAEILEGGEIKPGMPIILAEAKESQTRVVCAWCGKVLKVDSVDTRPRPISHGICQDCSKRVFTEMATPMQEFLDSFSAPVIVVDKEFSILAAGKKALTMARIDASQVKGLKCGDVFGCIHARKAEGCGKTSSCINCVMFDAIKYTQKTGLPRVRVPAYPDFNCTNKDKKIQYYVSSEKIGEIVVLILEDVEDGR
jgi:MOSC domain-containing protein YiiM